MTSTQPARILAGALAVALSVAPLHAAAQSRPGEAQFRSIFKELVETNTSLSVGSCTLAAERMAARLTGAGYPASDVKVWTAPDHPKEGGLLAKLPGTDPKAKPILMLGHLDVVEAKREDWTRDPFTLVEENGYFYARGTSDMKSMDAIWIDTLIRYRTEGFKPRRTIKLALTCGEESSAAFNGASWLAKNDRAAIDAAFAINEGGGGRLDAQGKPVALSLQVGEKFPQNYRLEVTNPGGHSSRPVKNNAITRLAAGLVKVGQYDFPVEFSDTTRASFTALSKITPGETGAAMAALVKNPQDKAAEAIVSRDPSYNSTLRTTCVPTMLDGGHASNALPQRAGAIVNCRIFPGTSVETVRQALERVVADPEIKVTAQETRSQDGAPAPPLTPQVYAPAEKVAREMFPGVPLIPSMSTGATDGAFLTPVGVPTYGLSGIFGDPDGNGVHGLNERIRIKSLLDGRDYLYRVMKLYATSPGA